VPLDEELRRVVPAIAELRARLPGARISVDTFKAEVARQALEAGADMVNDISAGADPAMFGVVAAAGCPFVLMHMQGTPATMQREPCYRDVVGEVEDFLLTRARAAVAAGINGDALLFDPGIGFGKSTEHNRELLMALPRFAALGRPLLLGVSRKAFIAKLLGREMPPLERDQASHALHALLAEHCALLRVHDVRGAVDACRLAEALRARAVAGCADV
jgi:dihydropteroate synthase